MSAFQRLMAHSCRVQKACCRLLQERQSHVISEGAAVVAPLEAEIAALLGEVTA